LAKQSNRTGNSPDSFGNDDQILLGVLTAVEKNSNLSQRSISRELDVALGLANAYLKRCVRKGLIKIKQVPRRRYVYYLTPQGFAEKSRLAGQYFAASFTFFRRARAQMSDLMAECASRDLKRLVFAGVSELAEIGTLCAYDHPVELVAIVDAARAGEKFCGLPVWATLEECGPFDAVIVTNLTAPEAAFQEVKGRAAPRPVLAPRLLRIAMLPEENHDETAQAAAE
jgi:DNA-binding MarR family transcriptional regulator